MPLLGEVTNTHELGAADVSTGKIRSWVQTMKQQEGGTPPDVDKVNGNMDWIERSGNTSGAIYQLYKSLGSNPAKFLEYVKSKAPGEFPNYSGTDSGNGSNGSSNRNGATGGGYGDKIQSAISEVPQWAWWGAGGGVGLIVLISAVK